MNNRNFGLDVVRMCAILPVLVGHFSEFALKQVPTILYVGADLGVNFFFALSGFLIGGIILRDFERGFSWRVTRNFWTRRWMRTLPLYYAFFVVVSIVALTGGAALTLNHLPFLLFLQNLAWPMVNWYQESWSLAVEEWFYLLFPVFFVALVGLSARTRILVIAVALILAALALRVWAYNPASDFDLQVRRVVVFRLDAIAFGILAIWLVRSFENTLRKWSTDAGLIGLLGLSVTVAMMTGSLYPGDFFARTFTYSVASLSLAALVIWAYFHPVGHSKIIYWISTRSYALYLCNASILLVMARHSLFSFSTIASATIFSVCVIATSEVAHRLIEQPFMRRRPRELHSVITHGVDRSATGHRARAEAGVSD